MAIRNVKEKIIAAATEEFLSWGYDRTTMRAIAEIVGVNKALLHYYFESKEKLYYIVLKAQFSDLIGALLKIFNSEEDFEPWLRRLIKTLQKEVSSGPNFSLFLTRELQAKQKQLPRIFKELVAERMQGNFLDKIQTKLAKAGAEHYPADHFLLNVLSLCIYPGIARNMLELVLGKELFTGQDSLAQREEEIFQMTKFWIFENTGADK